MTYSEREQSLAREPCQILITGRAGFIGSNFVHHWCQHDPEAIVVVLT
jgi:dTDP-glucose 4,6-dehydratase